MRLSKKWIAVLLSACMMMPSAGMNVYAQGVKENGTEAVREQEDTSTENWQQEDTSAESQKQQEGTGTENQKQQESIGTENQKQQEGIGTENQTQQEDINTEGEKQQEGIINFIMQENATVSIPGQQNIAVSLGNEGMPVEGAKLFYQNGHGQEFMAEAAGIAENMVKFTMEFTDPSQKGVYELVSITYQSKGTDYQVDFKALGMDVKFGVNEETDAEPDELLIDDEVLGEVEANVVTLDENGNAVSENSLQDVLKEAQSQGAAAASGRAALPRAGSMVVMLDPGHDSTHAGARGNNVKEEEAVLKIAKYCKAELQKYAGVTVYMTRTTNDCPNGGYLVDSGTCNARRVELAVKKKANVYVSFHLNSNVSSVPSGVGIYYPNNNYRPNIGAEGKGLATEIYKNLSALGLSTWAGGILIRNSENNTLYPDGSLADYLGVIRRSKEAGIPAVLIEHAFLSNPSDASGFLSTDEKLKNLGVADAHGIANFYGLSEGKTIPEITGTQSRKSNCLRVNWSKAQGSVSYQLYRSTEKKGTYKKVAEVSKIKYDDAKVKPGVTYYYKVRAVYPDGVKSKFSPVQSGKTLAAPSITNVVSKSGGKLEVRWDGVEEAQEYELVRSASKTGGYSKIAVITAGTGNTYVDTNIEQQKDYYYKLRARGGANNGYSSYSKELSGWAISKTSITSVSSYNSTSLLIQWKEVPKAYAYQVSRSTSKKGTYEKVAIVKNGKTSYVDKKLEPKKTYYYKIRAINKVNNKNGYSGYCSAVSGSTITGTSITYVRSVTSGSMELKWKKDPSVYAYSIKRSTKKKGPYSKIAEIRNCDITEYVDKNTTGGKRYYYVVELIADKKGVKNYSGDSAPKGAMNLPKVSINFLETGANGITLNWKKAEDANSYQIMRSTQKTSGFSQIAEVDGEDNVIYTDTNVTGGTTYYYRVRAVRKGKYPGYGSYGAVSELTASRSVN